MKTHLQSQSTSSIAVGHQYQHQVTFLRGFSTNGRHQLILTHPWSSLQGMMHALSVIYRQHGIVGLWRGSSAAVPRVSIGSAAQLSTFSSSKELVMDLQVRPLTEWLTVYVLH